MQPAGHPAYFPTLTALRGIAALFVVAFHAPGVGLGTYFLAATHLVLSSYLWVDFFFVLSGFVLMHAYGAAFADRIRRRDVLSYLRARFARIYPLYAATLILLLALELLRCQVLGHHPAMFNGVLLDARLAPEAFLPSVFLVQSLGLFSVDTWNAPAWSISCEAVAYFLFPALALALGRMPRAAGALLVAGGAALLSAIYWVARPHDLDVTFDLGVFRCIAEFSLGMCCYAWYAHRGVPRWLAGDAAAAAIIAALLLDLHFALSDLVAVPLFCALVLAAVGNGGRFRRLLLTRPLRHLGEISYSIYLVHWPLMAAIAMAIYAATGIDPTLQGFGVAPRLGLLAFVVVATVLASGFTYRTIELPLRRLIAGRSGARRRQLRAELTASGEAAF
jgi:peptidoglycan/LPS O-acetylase OafA/YrhL